MWNERLGIWFFSYAYPSMESFIHILNNSFSQPGWSQRMDSVKNWWEAQVFFLFCLLFMRQKENWNSSGCLTYILCAGAIWQFSVWPEKKYRHPFLFQSGVKSRHCSEVVWRSLEGGQHTFFCMIVKPPGQRKGFVIVSVCVY